MRWVASRGSDYEAVREIDVLTADLIPMRENVYFVCTNGQRDFCCARYGLPTFEGLKELVGERVWQTTHLGGHRFAPNVLTLPQGVLYGRVDVDDVNAFVTTIESGDLSRPHVRGRSAFPPEAQFAELQVTGRVEALLDVREDRVLFQTNLGEEEIQIQKSSIPYKLLQVAVISSLRTFTQLVGPHNTFGHVVDDEMLLRSGFRFNVAFTPKRIADSYPIPLFLLVQNIPEEGHAPRLLIAEDWM
ncbi:MAG: hypothetical protein Ct9H300mP8_03300 [Gammaproteobacteria bacterium]|nr:MAG: hypothetical protein Ct9H300mP8_03300 [Gammaproteobacteria bacterium]